LTQGGAGSWRSRAWPRLAAATGSTTRAAGRQLTEQLGGTQRTRVVVILACVLGLSGADAATVGAAATQLRAALGIGDTGIGLLVTAASLVGAVASLPFGVLADRVRRTWTLGGAVAFWGVAMIWSATASSYGELLLARLALGAVTAASGPVVASLVGDYFAAGERGRIYGFILAGEMLGAGFGFAVSGDLAALSWRASFVALAIPAFVLAVAVLRMPEPLRGGQGVLPHLSASSDPADGYEPEQPEQPDLPRHHDAQELAVNLGVRPAQSRILRTDARKMGLLEATRFVLRLRTNVLLIASSACAYYFLAGVQTFGVEFAKDQFGANQALANVLLLVIGVAAVGGTLSGGIIGDALLHRGRLKGRVTTAAVAATAATLLFVPALLTHSLLAAVPYLMAAAFFLAGQGPPLDAARLDIVPAPLWGRAEAVRTLIRSLAQSLAPLAFGVLSEHAFGGGRTSLRSTFAVMLVPLAVSAFLLNKARRTYPVDVATAAAAVPQTPPPDPR
jgi:MFS family permease